MLGYGSKLSKFRTAAVRRLALWLQQSQDVFDAVEGFHPAEQGGDVEDMRTELAADEHDPQGHEQLAGLDGGGGGHFLEVCLEGGSFPTLFELQLADELDEEKLFGGVPLGPDGIQIEGVGTPEEKGGLGDEIG